MIVTVIKARELIDCNRDVTNSNEVLPGGVPCHGLNFQTSCVGVYKCFSLIVGFALTVTIWPREVVSCWDFILRAVPTFWAMSLVGIYPGRASVIALKHPQKRLQVICCEKSISSCWATWEDSCQHFVMPPLVSLQNDVWEMNTEILCWLCVTTAILVVLLVEANFPLGTTNQNTQIRVVTHR